MDHFDFWKTIYKNSYQRSLKEQFSHEKMYIFNFENQLNFICYYNQEKSLLLCDEVSFLKKLQFVSRFLTLIF